MPSIKFSDLIKMPPALNDPLEVDSRKWIRQKAQQVQKSVADPMRLIRRAEPRTLRTLIITGHMYLFYYDPKYEQQLPFYDRFPLVFPFKRISGGFLGINLHYLPYVLRARLMDALYATLTDQNMDEMTRLKINYRILQSSAKFKWFEPCVKHYLYSHVKSRFLHVMPTEWEKALFLPLERFQKATKLQVFADSKRKLGIR